MIIYQLHDKHGKHHAYSQTEADANKKNGWRTVTEEEFNGKKPQAKSIPAFETSPVTTASEEAPQEVVAVPKKRGPKPRVDQ